MNAADLATAVEPTTAAQALAVIDLETFPKPPPKKEFHSNPTLASYTTAGTIASVNDFLMKEFAKAGWKEAPHLVTSNDEYVDRLVSKDGYSVRATISSAGPDEVAVNLMALGNFDLRTLPRTKDAEPQDSTAVTAGHRSNLSIDDAYADLSQRMVQAGWQIVKEFQNAMPEVPHYRSVHFRKNAMRVNLGLAKDPAKPNEKTNVFYHAESVMPIDVPMIDHQQPMKFDSIENRASVPWQGDRAAMVELLSTQAQGFGWQLLNADAFVEEKSTVLYISVGTPIGIATRLIESGGKYYLSMERVKLPKL